jgi:hypothetical protein
MIPPNGLKRIDVSPGGTLPLEVLEAAGVKPQPVLSFSEGMVMTIVSG